MIYPKCPICNTGKLVPGFTSGPACDRGDECKEPPRQDYHPRGYSGRGHPLRRWLFRRYFPSGDYWFSENTEVQNP